MRTFLNNKLLLALTLAAVTSPAARAWTTSPITHRFKPSLLQLNGDIIPEPIDTSLPRDESIWKKEGERIILEVVVERGGKAEDVDIQWKPGQIIVTLSGDSFIAAKVIEEEEDKSGLEYDDKIDESAVQEFESEFEGGDGDDGDDEDEKEELGTDVVSIARGINFALGEEGDGSMAHNIAVHHSIEVTTPGARDELYGIMFESYKGFPVIAEIIDPKNKDKVKIVEGKLVERNEKQTVLNQKGRLRKLKNEQVISLKLPKAKREKGAK
jgi:hypothetical protein